MKALHPGCRIKSVLLSSALAASALTVLSLSPAIPVMSHQVVATTIYNFGFEVAMPTPLAPTPLATTAAAPAPAALPPATPVVRVAQPAVIKPVPALAATQPTPSPTAIHCAGDVLTTQYGALHLTLPISWSIKQSTPMHGTPELSSPIWFTHPAGTIIETTGYIDRPDGRWYEEIYTGTGWVRLG